jgi:hypothetical protein
MSQQQNILELYAIHDSFSKADVIEKIGERIISKETKERSDSEIYFDVKKNGKIKSIPTQIENYLKSAGKLLDGSFYGVKTQSNNGSDITYHIGDSTVKINITPLKAGSDTSDPEGCDWEVYGYELNAIALGKDSKEVIDNFSNQLKQLGFNIVDKEEFMNNPYAPPLSF